MWFQKLFFLLMFIPFALWFYSGWATDEKWIPDYEIINISAKAHDSSSGVWFTQEVPFRMYILSAFYDDRDATSDNSKHLRIVLVMEENTADEQYFCKIWYPDQKYSFLVRAARDPIGSGVKYKTVHLREYIVSCKLPNTESFPIGTAVVDSSNKDAGPQIRVEVPFDKQDILRVRKFDNIAACVSISYSHLDARKLVEWLEMQKILGISRVFIYNHSISADSGHVLKSYVQDNYVVLRQSHSFIADSREKYTHLHMSPVINDCIYRQMKNFRYIAVIDLDEVIVPRLHNSLIDMLKELPDILRLGNSNVGSYVFRNAYFFLDLVNQNKKQSASMYLRHNKRLPPSPQQYAIKSIIDSTACIGMHNHYCWRYTEEAGAKWMNDVEVPPRVALLHHYKSCHFDRLNESPGQCESLFKTAVYDTVVMKYRHSLGQALEQKFRLFNFTFITWDCSKRFSMKQGAGIERVSIHSMILWGY